MKRISKIILIAAALFAIPAQAQEPSWSDEQSQVWALVEQSWVDDVAENGKWPTDYIHDKYVAWGDNESTPRYKDDSIALARFLDESFDTVIYRISPAAIVLENDTAVVHYHLALVVENSTGERSNSVSGLVEILVREGRNWKWISSVQFDPKLND